MFKLLSRLRWCLAVCLLCSGMASGAEFVVIVSARNPVSTLRTEQVAAIFLGQSGRFPGGAEAVALDLPLGSALRNDFYNTVAARTPALMKAYWSKMVFTGRGQPPRELSGSVAVRKLVADNPAMIAYIDKSALDASVKAIQVTP
ncbi:phosphate ABC transporter substrate-binding protein [Pseudoduganella sp. FT26W]|uniref:Phosphate ABC transporter substrate-binding protein n=1 Tax=Duganella aquatilis TaxID=2666082 RepID=A0A844DAV4_9BURK|nr:phosphate ABC transporter substrate-binding protein [Duganella aquatilis]MRW84820.1 phosphate ABC transporter substrate-binding protein [Duganella aquatilis]